ncbi:AAA family ATPase [Brucella sp. BO3]|uniref:AAA family ATPase n=1 Tax=unclassified Brucella TaxID=2632610 RepID=UPI00084F87AE|nr:MULTISPECIES: AAA family ATPase [unclassified Brucella]OEI84666.1 DNA transposition protein [Brucella sp. B13-0095]QMV26696.1 AAA family ATPase [Brucella sp. BO3]
MKDVSNTIGNRAAGAWERPLTGPELTANRTQQDIDTWWVLIDHLLPVVTANKWSKIETAKRIDMPESTFSAWFSGRYNGRLDAQNKLVQQWLDALEEAADMDTLPSSPPFFLTKTSVEIEAALKWAQRGPDLVMVTQPAGVGKTMTCRQYRATRPHVYMVTMSPHTRTVHGMMVDLASELDVIQHNPAKLTRAIGNRLSRSGAPTLLIVDEAQNLQDEAIDQLRHFVDVYKCGVALIGNDEIHGRFLRNADKPNGPSQSQLRSRIGKRLRYSKPHREDLLAFIEKWDVTDSKTIELLLGIGMKGGALRQIDKTMRLASEVAQGLDMAVTYDIVKKAWENRDVEDLVA